jgi:NADPH:quinone reductase-like Zn-dependent oxidoreductase
MKSHSWQFDAYGAPDLTLRWREQELAEPGPGQAWVKIHAIGMNFSDRTYVLGQHFPTGKFPSCLGGEAVGEIIALGPRADSGPAPVSRLQLDIGARVGTLSGRVNGAAMGVYHEEAAALWTAMITMGGAMEMGGMTAATAAGKRVLITAGGSGMAGLALKLASSWGATTIATTRKADKAAKLGQLADRVIVCTDSASLVEGVQKATNGQGVDLVLDPVGAAFYPGFLAAAARGAAIVSYECISGTQANISIMDMMMKDVSFHGFTIFRPMNDPAMLNRLVDIGLDNAQVLRPLVSRTFDLSAAPEALEVLGRSEHLGKMVIKA